MLIRKYMLSTLILLLFSNMVFAENCKMIFDKLDKKYSGIEGADRIKRFVKLESDLFKAIKKCRSFSGMFVLMGEVQIDLGQAPLAAVYGKKSVGLDAKYWRAHKLLGIAKMLNKEITQGLAALQKAYDLKPGNINTQLNLASALIENKKFDESMELVNNAIKVIEKNNLDDLAAAYFIRSKAYAGKGLIIEADNDVRKAKKLGFVIN